MPFELDQTPDRPNICIGTDDFHTPERIANRAVDLFQQESYSLALNRPYPGSIVPFGYYQADKRVASLMIEINRSLYMDESTGSRLPAFKNVKENISKIILRIKTEFEAN